MPLQPVTKDAPESSNFYASLNIQEGHNIYGLRSAQELLYEVVERPKSETPSQNHCFKEHPMFNILKDHSTTQPSEIPADHGAESAYKSLEDFNLEDVEGPGHYDDNSSERPIYNTLEEPYWDGPYEPVYNFIEEGKAEHFNS